MQMSKQELVEAANEMTGGNIKDLSLHELHRLITVALYVSDLCLNEIEDRRALLLQLRRRSHTDPAGVARPLSAIISPLAGSIILTGSDARALTSRRSRRARRVRPRRRDSFRRVVAVGRSYSDDLTELWW